MVSQKSLDVSGGSFHSTPPPLEPQLDSDPGRPFRIQRSRVAYDSVKVSFGDQQGGSRPAQHILPSSQRRTRRVRNRTPLYELSIRLVVTRQRDRLGVKPRDETVNIPSRPSRKLAALLGYSPSSHCACFSLT